MKIGYHVAADAVAYAFGYAADIFVAVVYFAESCGKRNGVYCLNDAFRHIGSPADQAVAAAFFSCRLACKNFNVAVAAVKNRFL